MTYTTLISPTQLQALMNSDAPPRVFDCSFDLMQPQAGPVLYAQGHIPTAVYAHLDADLSAKNDLTAASGGRHPLPSREALAAWLGRSGLRNGQQAVVYDRNGLNYCGRLWWMLKWAGHEVAAVLDGGLQAWQNAGGALSSGVEPAPTATTFALRPPCVALVTAAELAQRLGHPGQTVLDARATARFRGDVEPLDPVAGHIPGALNRPFGANLGADGCLKPADQLRNEFEALLAGRDAAGVVHQCGSGVSAVPNLLAMEVAGLGRSALFAGSWSEWCNTPGLPCAQG